MSGGEAGSSIYGTRHRRLVSSLHPRRTTLPRYVTWQSSFVNSMVQPASHRTPAERRLFRRPASTWTARPPSGNAFNKRQRVVVVFMVALFGMSTVFYGS